VAAGSLGGSGSWPNAMAFLGSAQDYIIANSANYVTYSFTNYIPSGILDVGVSYNGPGSVGNPPSQLYIQSITLTRQ